MFQKLLNYAGELFMEKSKGIAVVAAISLILGITIVVGIISSKYFGDDNAIEQGAEIIIDEVFESGLQLPDGSVNIDLSPEMRDS